MIRHVVTRKKLLLEVQNGFTKDNKNIKGWLETRKVPKKNVSYVL